jgi:hypothetical protein
MPDTTWSTAALTFQGSIDGENFQEVMTSAGSAYTVDVASNQFVILDPTTLRGLTSLKVRSGTSGSPVTQSAGAVITLVTRGVE